MRNTLKWLLIGIIIALAALIVCSIGAYVAYQTGYLSRAVIQAYGMDTVIEACVGFGLGLTATAGGAGALYGFRTSTSEKAKQTIEDPISAPKNDVSALSQRSSISSFYGSLSKEPNNTIPNGSSYSVLFKNNKNPKLLNRQHSGQTPLLQGHKKQSPIKCTIM